MVNFNKMLHELRVYRYPVKGFEEATYRLLMIRIENRSKHGIHFGKSEEV